jgi:hypothetical protein
MYILTNKEFNDHAMPNRSSIFPFTNELPFAESITDRMILFYCRWRECVSPETLTLAAKRVGDEGILLFPCLDNICCYIPLREFADGCSGADEKLISQKLIVKNYVDSVGTVFEEVPVNPYDSDIYFCSPTGKWGLYVDFDGIGYLGGSQKFMDVIRSNTPELGKQVYRFIKRMREEYNSSFTENTWVRSILAHIYDKQSAAKMIQEVYEMSEEEAHW